MCCSLSEKYSSAILHHILGSRFTKPRFYHLGNEKWIFFANMLDSPFVNICVIFKFSYVNYVTYNDTIGHV